LGVGGDADLLPRVARAARSRRTGGSSSPASMAAGGDKRGEERRGLAGRKELAATVGRPIQPGYQLGHLEKSRGLSLSGPQFTTNARSHHRFRDLQNIQTFPKKTKYSK